MITYTLQQRFDWIKKCEAVGFNFHSLNGTYWDESHCYQFSAAEIDAIESATEILHEMAIEATSRIISAGDYDKYGIPDKFAPFIEASWRRKDPSLYGRMDLCCRPDGSIKLLEYNADTPTSLLEASVAQWDWLVDQDIQGKDQFNSIHEKLVDRWKSLYEQNKVVHIAAVKGNLEDINTAEYLFRTASEAGLNPKWVFIEDIGLDRGGFVDIENNAIDHLFKLYPTEWLLDETFAPNILSSDIVMLEPLWKVVTSSKAILVKLWEMFPEHPNLLPCYFSSEKLRDGFVKKPVFSREGANIKIFAQDSNDETGGLYDAGKFVFQEYRPLPRFNDSHMLVGSWIIGDQAAGIGIREDQSLITQNTSRFVPHYFI